QFLPAVAEGRIAVMPWIDEIDGNRVLFRGGRRGEFDGIILGTGYRLSLPFLDAATAATLGLDDVHMDLHDHTFHPDLPGL
ncbi:MAG: dimethylaniline monooxygenase, partial [Rhizobiaceae bacterium]|nr:dimethylaniline monooxygenase [Rhizobiaceae bacterium]